MIKKNIKLNIKIFIKYKIFFSSPCLFLKKMSKLSEETEKIKEEEKKFKGLRPDNFRTSGEKLNEVKQKLKEKEIEEKRKEDKWYFDIETVPEDSLFTCVCLIDNFDNFCEGMLNNIIFLNNNDYIKKVHIVINNMFYRKNGRKVLNRDLKYIVDKRLIEIMTSFYKNGAHADEEMGVTLGKINVTYNRDEDMDYAKLIMLMTDICETKNIFFIRDNMKIKTLLFNDVFEEFLTITTNTHLPVYYPSTRYFILPKGFVLEPGQSICSFIRIPNLEFRHLPHYNI